VPIRILASHTYKLGGADWWGRDGFAGNVDAASNALTIRSFAAGTAFALAADRASSQRFLAARGGRAEHWLQAASYAEQGTSYYPEPLSGALPFDVESETRADLALQNCAGWRT
jgi:hypothetical protein